MEGFWSFMRGKKPTIRFNGILFHKNENFMTFSVSDKRLNWRSQSHQVDVAINNLVVHFTRQNTLRSKFPTHKDTVDNNYHHFGVLSLSTKNISQAFLACLWCFRLSCAVLVFPFKRLDMWIKFYLFQILKTFFMAFCDCTTREPSYY